MPQPGQLARKSTDGENCAARCDLPACQSPGAPGLAENSTAVATVEATAVLTVLTNSLAWIPAALPRLSNGHAIRRQMRKAPTPSQKAMPKHIQIFESTSAAGSLSLERIAQPPFKLQGQ
jgi:hypothetical protein